MCGIIGILNFNDKVDEEKFVRLRDILTHRGPDGYGIYVNEKKNIALGHRRLSLIDLSESGTQPMCNEDKSVWLTANGEIYNYPELKRTLQQKGHTFFSSSDSEVIIHGYEEWGTDVLNKLKGMFAFGLWDEKKQQLFLARDRFGIKPLYYYINNNRFIFSSEIKAIIEDPDVEREIDFSSFCDFFVYRYIPSPKTIWKNIYKIPPAHYLIMKRGGELQIQEYWELNSGNESISEKEVVAQTDQFLENSVKGHLLSDLPVGSFLSGGYDSSALVYYMSRLGHPTSTFSIGFKNWDKSEHQYAEIVARTFGTQHTSKIIDQQELGLLDKLSYYYDEPLADISTIPTFLVSELASQNVKAVVSGEGADEIFSGYTWHKTGTSGMSFFEKINYYKDQCSAKTRKFSLNDYANAMSMGYFGKEELRQLLHPDICEHIPDDPLWFYRKHYKPELPGVKRFQYLDIKTFMGELVLTKVDRASMANSLEVRVPFLDHELVEFIFKHSVKTYIHKNVKKFLLYENIKAVLPREILERNKQGFVGPDSYYMNIGWYKNILSDSKLVADKIINANYADQLLAGKDHWRLWKIIIMEYWYRKFKNKTE